MAGRLRIGEHLVEAGVLTQAQLDKALIAQRDGDQKLGQVLVEQGAINETQLTQTLSQQLSVPWVSLSHIDIPQGLLSMVPRDLADGHCLIPIFVRRVRKQGDVLYVAMDDPTQEAALAAVASATGLTTKPMIASAGDIRRAIRAHYGSMPGAEPVAPAAAVPAPAPTPLAKPATVPGFTPVAKPEELPVASQRDPFARVSRPAALPPPPPSRAPGAMPAASAAPVTAAVISGDSPDDAPELEAKEHVAKNRPEKQGRAFGLTLLDGTTIPLPTFRQSRLPDEPEAAPPSSRSARELVASMRANRGEDPRFSERLVEALMTLLLKKGLVLDSELAEELRRIQSR